MFEVQPRMSRIEVELAPSFEKLLLLGGLVPLSLMSFTSTIPKFKQTA
jgi:hypothetical protein